MLLGLISLGCAKNKVDSEIFLGIAKKYNIEITNSLEDADIIVINTCGFIEDAKKESLDTIMDCLEYQRLGKKIVVMGCLVQRYLDELKKELPEVDFFIPIKDYDMIHKFFNELTLNNNIYNFDYQARILSTPTNTSYLRIGDGCNNRCSYCAIPIIRGNYRSRSIESIMLEVNTLIEKKIEEVTIIAQDTSAYGSDLKDMSLSILLDKIASLKRFKWIRVLYLYPDEITDELIETFKKHDSIVNYFDIPIQHANNRLLKLMNRRGSKELIKDLILKIRKNIPNSIIRTTLIVGFPTETKQEFNELLDFVKEIKFDHLGVFTYSDEDDTKGKEIYPKIAAKTKESRRIKILDAQEKINTTRLLSLIGKTFECIVDHFDSDTNCFGLRYFAQALDDVDGYIYVSDADLVIGEYVDVVITDVDGYDLIGKVNK